MVPEEHITQQDLPAFPYNQSSNFDNRFPKSDFIDNFKSSHFGFSRQVSLPETVSLDPNSYRSIKIPMDDLELNSPSSVVFSLYQDPEAKASKIQDEVLTGQEMEQEEDEVMSSYTIEINANHREGTEGALSINEAIAWAKDKFYTQSSEKFWSKDGNDQSTEAEGFSNGQIDGNGSMRLPVKQPNKWAPKGEEQLQKDIEMELLDEEIRSWSAGKEANIQMLLSMLHHILWPNSGWYAIPLTSLVESSQVKKAYQKARLCLHPDKLQQRGATIKQKYVADNAFAILQTTKEVWDYLAERYSLVDGANEYQSSLEFHDLRFEPGQTLTDFYNKMSNLWNHLTQFESTWTCPTDASTFHVYRARSGFRHFLVALPPDYEHIRASLLHRHPLPTVGQALAELRSVETRKKTMVYQHSQPVQATPS
ncbi:chaperone DnaJ-domain superfamily protein [Actinidia rufa]|uniref:Chaperone DnaJ-domain superfamily protein n=1 Tax=Actinidia rufa TaxID=165716 RepID=A0A7J0E009_9ERIC|nr:chaperone DnaJ-domain superfamily protein [Actinidia rufa]